MVKKRKAEADERFNIAKKILDRAISLGIDKKNVFVDCLTLTASAEQEGVMETVKALKRVKEELGLKTVLGVSNISFGLPRRDIINSNFFAMALNSGLDACIINPLAESMMDAYKAFRAIYAYDENCLDYIKGVIK